jgi:hypothetical protein
MRSNQKLFCFGSLLIMMTAAPPPADAQAVVTSPDLLSKHLGRRVSVRGTWTYSNKDGTAILLSGKPKTNIYVSTLSFKKTAGARPSKTLSTVTTNDLEQVRALLKEGDVVVGTGKLENFDVRRKISGFQFFYMDECQITEVKHAQLEKPQ